MGDPKDIAFYLLWDGYWYYLWSRFYLLAILFRSNFKSDNLPLAVVDYGQGNVNEKVLKITIPENMHYENVFDDIFAYLFRLCSFRWCGDYQSRDNAPTQYTIRSNQLLIRI